MKDIFPSLDGLRPNPDRAKLPIFDRKGWKRVRFGDVVENLNETERNPAEAGLERFIGLEHLEPGSLHIRAWGNVAEGTTFTRRCRPGQVLFGKRRAYQRKVSVAEFDAVVSGDIYVLAQKNDRLLSELLPFICMSERFFQHAVGTSAGSLSPRTNWCSLAGFEFDLPPLDQQRCIAEILRAVDETKLQKKVLLESLRALHKTILDITCSQNGERRPLGEVVVYASDGPFGSKLKTEHYADVGIRVIRLQNIGEGYFDHSNKAFISPQYFRELKRYEVCAGDIIVAGLGDETHPVGRATVIPDSLGQAINKADCFCIRADENNVLNAYLAYFLNSKSGTEQVAARAQGTTRMRINVGNIKTVLVHLQPLEQQAQLVGKLGRIEQSMAKVEDAVAESVRLATSLQNSIFEG
jgi:type I restriction enzyme, S subunit